MFEQPPLSFALRLLIFGLVAVGVVASPVLAFAAEVHEAQHAFEGAHVLDEHVATGNSAQPGEADGSGDPWHGLMHLCHFCGHCVSLVPGAGSALGQTFVKNQPAASALSTAFDSLAVAALFRPPIPR